MGKKRSEIAVPFEQDADVMGNLLPSEVGFYLSE